MSVAGVWSERAGNARGVTYGKKRRRRVQLKNPMRKPWFTFASCCQEPTSRGRARGGARRHKYAHFFEAHREGLEKERAKAERRAARRAAKAAKKAAKKQKRRGAHDDFMIVIPMSLPGL